MSTLHIYAHIELHLCMLGLVTQRNITPLFKVSGYEPLVLLTVGAPETY